jgi:hypothetical protein
MLFIRLHLPAAQFEQGHRPLISFLYCDQRRDNPAHFQNMSPYKVANLWEIILEQISLALLAVNVFKHKISLLLLLFGEQFPSYYRCTID